MRPRALVSRKLADMKWRTGLVCILAATWAVTASGAQNKPVRSDQQVLIQLERDWDAASRRKDIPFIERILAAEFIGTYVDGSRGDRAKELALVKEFNQQVDSSLQDDFTVKVYGDTAVVWFTLHLVGPSQGRRTEVTYRYVDVFVWRDDRWQCVTSQSTRVAT